MVDWRIRLIIMAAIQRQILYKSVPILIQCRHEALPSRYRAVCVGKYTVFDENVQFGETAAVIYWGFL